MELGRRPAGAARGPSGPSERGEAFFDDVDRAYVVAQLEETMEDPVELHLAARRCSPLLLPGAGAGAEAPSEEGRRAERMAREIEALTPRLRVIVTDDDAGDIPVFTIRTRGSGVVRFLGVPRVNLFRALLETIRRASTHDHGLPADQVQALRGLAADVHARVFATPTCPSCPPVVLAAVAMALAAERMQVDVVDGIAGMELVREWGVSGVPTVVLNDRISVEGPVRDDTLCEFVLHAADPSHPAPAIASVPFRSCGRLD